MPFEICLQDCAANSAQSPKLSCIFWAIYQKYPKPLSSLMILCKSSSLMCSKHINLAYRKVASRSTSRLVAHLRVFRLLMKGRFDAYVLWPLTKRFKNWIVDRSSARDYTVCEIEVGCNHNPAYLVGIGLKECNLLLVCTILILTFKWSKHGNSTYRKVASINTSDLEASPRFYRLSWRENLIFFTVTLFF